MNKNSKMWNNIYVFYLKMFHIFKIYVIALKQKKKITTIDTAIELLLYIMKKNNGELGLALHYLWLVISKIILFF